MRSSSGMNELLGVKDSWEDSEIDIDVSDVPSESACFSKNSFQVQGNLSVMSPTSSQIPEANVNVAQDAPAVVLTAASEAMLRLRSRLGCAATIDMVSARQLLRALNILGLYRLDFDNIQRVMLALRVEFEDAAPPRLSHQDSCLSRTSMREHVSDQRKRFGYMPEEEYEVHLSAFIEAFHAMPSDLRDRLGAEDADHLLTIKNVLLSGDANKLVAELTNVRVDDLAQPPPAADMSSILEPMVGLMIVANGVLIGVQASYQLDADAWFWADFGFAVFFFFEMLIRIGYLGLREHFLGHDWAWNLFDALMVFLAAFDILMTTLVAEESPAQHFTVMRFLRMTRLVRLARIFRFRFLNELTLMVKGLVGGLRTLAWAMVLLMFTIYIIAVFATMTIGTTPSPYASAELELERESLFGTVLDSSFTLFRCYIGDCISQDGKPLVKLLANAYGWMLVLAWMLTYLLVAFGIFNLIMAVYIEQTLEASKDDGIKSRCRRERESLRIALTTKRLLVKFCRAQRALMESAAEDTANVTVGLVGSQGGDRLPAETIAAVMRRSEGSSGSAGWLRTSFGRTISENMEDILLDDLDIEISKESFHLILQDPEVQQLMDSLGIPPQRADLFDILDADASGGLQVTELVQGLLKVRGETRKSDIVGSYLGIRAIQESLRRMEKESLEQRALMERFEHLMLER